MFHLKSLNHAVENYMQGSTNLHVSNLQEKRALWLYLFRHCWFLYSSVTPELLSKELDNWYRYIHVNVTQVGKQIITYAHKKVSPIKYGEVWSKTATDELFDILIGSYNYP